MFGLVLHGNRRIVGLVVVTAALVAGVLLAIGGGGTDNLGATAIEYGLIA